jgi:hypothetical protein
MAMLFSISLKTSFTDCYLLTFNYYKIILTVQKYRSENKLLWDGFIDRSLQGTFLFHRDFMEYHANRFDDYSLLVFKGEDLLAVLPAHITDNILYSHQGLTYGGIVHTGRLKFVDILQVYKAILCFLEAHNISLLSLKALPQIYYKTPDFSSDYVLHILEANHYRTDVLSVVNPRLKNYSRGRKEGYKRGVKSNLKVLETDDFFEFWTHILLPNLKRKHNTEPVHNLAEISLLKSRFKNQIRQFNVYKGKTLVGGATIFETDTVAHAQYISGNSDKNKLGSLDFLHIYLLENVFQDKLFFDFGSSNENQGKSINQGLLFWKQGFGASIYNQNYYTVATKNHSNLDNLMI